MLDEYTRIEGWHIHPVNIDTSGFQNRYPWPEMEPGAVVCIFDTSAYARSKLSANAARAGKRLGRRFSTGYLYDEAAKHVGWWAARVDGCEIGPKRHLSHKVRHGLEKREEQRLIRKEREAERRNNPPKIIPALPLGSEEAKAYGDPMPAPGPPIDYATADLSEWQTPVPVAGEATEGEAF